MREHVASLLAVGAKAGVAYASSVFAIGFLLGAVRVLLLAPHLGAVAAVSLEMPIILAASWYVSSYFMRRFRVGTEIHTRLLVGVVAFVVLANLEIALSVSLFHKSMAEYLTELRTRAGALGFTGQIVFATFPLLGTLATRRVNRSRICDSSTAARASK